MSAGIVRRIDELGRIVIPKEFRRTMRLKEGDEMEILSSGDAITLKKYSGFESLLSTVKAVASLLARSVDADVLFVSTEGVEIAEGKNRRRYVGARFSDEFAAEVRKRKTEVMHGEQLKNIFSDRECATAYGVIEPVAVNGDLVGAAMLMLDRMPSELARAYLHFSVELIQAALE